MKTAACRAHAALAARLLDGAAGSASAWAPLSLLGRFLIESDIRAIRAGHPALAGGEACAVRLYRGGGDVVWELWGGRERER